MDFGEALKFLKTAHRMQRAGWTSASSFVFVKYPVAMENDTMEITLPIFIFRTMSGNFLPWLPSPTDLLATDWRIAP